MIFNKKVLSSCCVGLALLASGESFGMQQDTRTGSSRGANGTSQIYSLPGYNSASGSTMTASAGQFVESYQTPSAAPVQPLEPSRQSVCGSSVQQLSECPSVFVDNMTSQANLSAQTFSESWPYAAPGCGQGQRMRMNGEVLTFEKKDNGGKSETDPTFLSFPSCSSFVPSSGGQGQMMTTNVAGSTLGTKGDSGESEMRPVTQVSPEVQSSTVPSAGQTRRMARNFEARGSRRESGTMLTGPVSWRSLFPAAVNSNRNEVASAGNGFTFSSGQTNTPCMDVGASVSDFDGRMNALVAQGFLPNDSQFAGDLTGVGEPIQRVLPGGDGYRNNCVVLDELGGYYADENVRPDAKGYDALTRGFINQRKELAKLDSKLKTYRESLAKANDTINKYKGEWQSKIESLTRGNKDLKRRNGALQKENADLQSAQVEMKEKLTEAGRTLQERDDAINALNAGASELAAKIESLERTNEGLEQHNEALQKEKTDLQSAQVEMKERLAGAERALQEKEDTINVLEAEVRDCCMKVAERYEALIAEVLGTLPAELAVCKYVSSDEATVGNGLRIHLSGYTAEGDKNAQLLVITTAVWLDAKDAGQLGFDDSFVNNDGVMYLDARAEDVGVYNKKKFALRALNGEEKEAVADLVEKKSKNGSGSSSSESDSFDSDDDVINKFDTSLSELGNVAMSDVGNLEGGEVKESKSGFGSSSSEDSDTQSRDDEGLSKRFNAGGNHEVAEEMKEGKHANEDIEEAKLFGDQEEHKPANGADENGGADALVAVEVVKENPELVKEEKEVKDDIEDIEEMNRLNLQDNGADENGDDDAQLNDDENEDVEKNIAILEPAEQGNNGRFEAVKPINLDEINALIAQMKVQPINPVDLDEANNVGNNNGEEHNNQ